MEPQEENAMVQIREWRGDRPTGKAFAREAPKGKFRVVVFNQMEGSKWCLDDFSSFQAAKAAANGRASDSVVVDVYDDSGKQVFEAGEAWNE